VPNLIPIPTNNFLEDLESFRRKDAVRKKIVKALRHLENTPLHPGLGLERITNDPSAWAIRVDRRYRISLDPEKHHASGNPEWNANVLLLRILDHDDLYKHLR